MNTIEYRWIDKSEWHRGEWDSEPDKVQWEDAATSLPCLAVRHPTMGNWCGYVAVSEGHPYFGKDYKDVGKEYTDVETDIDCHGGLTFSGFCREDDKEHGICHVPAPGEPDRVWWLGFDCGHAYDLAPGLVATIESIGCRSWPGDVYRNLAYVQKECAEIARQLHEC